jgi:hypothetical protein
LKKRLTHLALDAANVGKHTALDAVVMAYRQQTQVYVDHPIREN